MFCGIIPFFGPVHYFVLYWYYLISGRMYKSRDASYRGTYGDKREVDTTLYLHYKLWRDLK